MRTLHAWLLVLIVALGLSGPVAGQSSMQKLLDSLAGRKTPPPALAVSSNPVRESDARLMEILVELAWLGDPLTFPFYLEARVEGPLLQIHGNVPSPAVHEHALKLAQMNAPLPVADGLKENPRLVVRPTRMSPDHLQNVVRAALRESLPGQAKNLQIRCTADGQVAVLGAVDSFERKLAVSQALRRLHGCTVVINLTKVAYDQDGSLARNALRQPVQTVSKTTTVSPAAVVPVPGNGVVKNGSPVPPGSPADTNNKVQPPSVPSAGVGIGPRLSLAQIQKRIKDACPKAREVRVSAEANGDIKLEIQVLEEADCDVVINQVFALPDLGTYPLRPNFTVGGPGKN